MRPDVVTYTSLIKCWNESGHLKAANRAEEIIEMLHAKYEKGHVECKPDTMVYNVAMNALAKSVVSPERAEALLNRMLDCYYAGDVDLAEAKEVADYLKANPDHTVYQTIRDLRSMPAEPAQASNSAFD